ncbi:UDP-N-acetylglucosamine 4-epimerase [Enterovibrio norvegicus]|uniref:NAD-dependent epimerase/dehydratase family protein n=1 Tax=Enterovibrio norvegicus TaxID=188144 RepID=UPI00031F57D4|nr:NAD-dependent epimerase/dehydratase family protein [Enterovibrio norvegicus]OEE57323.1 UDP-N-acetylglucosamine 4-epimerase [Enterovibrio norvegicus]
MKILVVGGSGFIGTRLVSLLISEGHDVTIYDKLKSNTYPELTIVGDIRDIQSLKVASKGFDIIYNLAAEHADNVSPISLYYDVNVDGTENVVKAAEENGIYKIIFTSSVAIYALNSGDPKEDNAVAPFNDYGKSKWEAEKVLSKWLKEDETRSLSIVRPSVVFGEGNRGNVYNLINQVSSGRFLMVGSGKNYKSMAYVGNVANFLLKQIVNGAGNHIYNYADKPDLSSREIVDIVKAEMAIATKFPTLPYSVGMLAGHTLDIVSKVTNIKFPVSAVRIKKFCADTTVNSDAAMSSGFNPSYTLKDGLVNMINHDFKKK